MDLARGRRQAVERQVLPDRRNGKIVARVGLDRTGGPPRRRPTRRSPGPGGRSRPPPARSRCGSWSSRAGAWPVAERPRRSCAGQALVVLPHDVGLVARGGDLGNHETLAGSLMRCAGPTTCLVGARRDVDLLAPRAVDVLISTHVARRRRPPRPPSTVAHDPRLHADSVESSPACARRRGTAAISPTAGPDASSGRLRRRRADIQGRESPVRAASGGVKPDPNAANGTRRAAAAQDVASVRASGRRWHGSDTTAAACAGHR